MQEIIIIISSFSLLLMILVLRRLSDVVEAIEVMNEKFESSVSDENTDLRLEDDLNHRLDQIQRARFSYIRIPESKRS
jgi:hypothetical protein